MPYVGRGGGEGGCVCVCVCVHVYFLPNISFPLFTRYNEEEVKMIKETEKIFHTTSIGITATCVRVPVLRAHCESINITLS